RQHKEANGKRAESRALGKRCEVEQRRGDPREPPLLPRLPIHVGRLDLPFVGGILRAARRRGIKSAGASKRRLRKGLNWLERSAVSPFGRGLVGADFSPLRDVIKSVRVRHL